MDSLTSRVRTKEINGKNYQIYLLKASDGIAIAQKLSGIVATMFEGSNLGSDEFVLDFAKIARAISTEITNKDMMTLITTLIKDLAVDGRGITFDEYFAGNYGELISVITFALQENFGNFFDEMATIE